MDEVISEKLQCVLGPARLTVAAEAFRDNMVATFSPESTSGQVALFITASSTPTPLQRLLQIS